MMWRYLVESFTDRYDSPAVGTVFLACCAALAAALVVCLLLGIGGAP